ncbi:MAG: inorganic phosphate transporter [Clostridia bacterium]|nr:inorganic phosphate transporter [Clostridia bacterium]
MSFWSNIDTPLGFFTFFFALLVVFVNGWTDAPNSIFSVVDSGVLKLWQGALLSGIFNFLGVLLSSILGASVAKTIFSLTDFGSKSQGFTVCLSCFITIVLFGVIAWFFGLPSSESHALIFSLSGSLLATGVKNNGFFKEIAFIVLYLIFSCVISFLISFLITKITQRLRLPYKKLLVASSSLLSFMHGAQDGQKFLGVLIFILGFGTSQENFTSLPLILIIAAVMSLSTLLGGGRIIKSLSKTASGKDLHSAFSSDLGSFFTLALCSFFGMPISTGNVKSLSIVGSSVAKKEKINKKMTGMILLTSVITLPICFLMGFIICKLLLLIL